MSTRSPSDPTILYIDGDILRYQVGSIMQKHPFLPDEQIPADPKFIYQTLDTMITKAFKSTGAVELRVVLSGKGNFRNDIATLQPYKGNREDSVKPPHFKTVEDYLKEKYPTIIIHDREADDYLGDVLRYFPDHAICGSRDKDLRTVPGWHYSWACGDKQPEKPLYRITNYQAWHFFFYQCLIGDNTDNIIGCGIKKEVKWGKNEDGTPRMMMRRKGVGSVGALKILDNAKDTAELYQRVYSEYENVFEEKADEAFIENARLLYIGQTKDNLFSKSWIKCHENPEYKEVNDD